MKKRKGTMKTRIVTIAAGLLMLLAIGTPETAQAVGPGEKSVGVIGGYSSYNGSAYLSANFQWEFANHFRLAPEIGVSFENDHKSAFLLSCDIHFPFQVYRGIVLYPLVGLTMNSWHYSWDDDDEYRTRVGGDFGAGVDFYFTRSFKMTLQAKYSAMAQTSGAFAGIGLSYVF